MTTPRLGAPELSTSQASKEATVNEIAYLLDAGAGGGFLFLDRNINTPAGSPAQGDTYLLGGAPTGAWSGQANNIAIYYGTAWTFRAAKAGFVGYVDDEDIWIGYNGTSWDTLSVGGTGVYTAGGTDVALADGGTGSSLVDPNADRVMFWDDSAGAVTWLTMGTGLTITGTTLDAAAGTGYNDEQAQDAIGTILVDSSTIDFTYNDGTPSITATVIASAVKPTESLIIACSDETTALTAGTAKVTFRMPYAFTLSAVRASVTTAPTGSVLTVDINEAGASILSTKLTIDASEKTSTTAATAAVISDSSLADDAEMTIDIDGVGSTIAGAGLKVYLIGSRT